MRNPPVSGLSNRDDPARGRTARNEFAQDRQPKEVTRPFENGLGTVLSRVIDARVGDSAGYSGFVENFGRGGVEAVSTAIVPSIVATFIKARDV